MACGHYCSQNQPNHSKSTKKLQKKVRTNINKCVCVNMLKAIMVRLTLLHRLVLSCWHFMFTRTAHVQLCMRVCVCVQMNMRKWLRLETTQHNITQHFDKKKTNSVVANVSVKYLFCHTSFRFQSKLQAREDFFFSLVAVFSYICHTLADSLWR